ncbi:MAG: S9 family peptidase [Pseudomonadota bacterium]|nr:S9 family peptidase [Pseudomonadota bacterium]
MSRQVRALVLVMSALAATQAQAGWFFKDKVTEAFLRPEVVREASLSPDGKHLAVVGTTLVDDDIRTALVLVDTDSGETRSILSPVRTRDADNPGMVYMRQPVRVAWMSNALLAVDFNDDTANQISLGGRRVGWLGARFLGMIRPDGEKTKVALVKRYSDASEIGTVAPNAEEVQPLQIKGVKGSISRLLTDSTGLIRVLQTIQTAQDADVSRVTTWYRQGEAAEWTQVIDQSLTDDRIEPVFIGHDANHLVVQARNGSDRLAMWNYDVEHKAFGDVAAAHPSEDIVAVDADEGAREFKRVATEGLQAQTVWFDQRMANLQAAIDAALPGHINELQGSVGTRILVTTFSDVDPGKYLLLDTGTKTLKEIAAARPQIDPVRMQPMQRLHYPAADGLSIPAYLTLPGHPAKPAPTIVLIHGGPQARDHWAWNQDVQLFAAHGYAVFQPQFRGSSGFGKHFEEAGYGQWGQTMQADITAGVRYLIDHQIADPNRICIIGGSYGGYAALWGLAQTPDLYKCGVSLAGVSDLEKELKLDSDISKSAVQREYARSRIGDPALMKAVFDSVSPLLHADQIKAPLLIVHGTLDERVPLSQGRQMFDRMRALHKDVQWIEFDKEGHSLWRVEDQRDYYDAVFELLERTIGKGIAPADAPARP